MGVSALQGHICEQPACKRNENIYIYLQSNLVEEFTKKKKLWEHEDKLVIFVVMVPLGYDELYCYYTALNGSCNKLNTEINSKY